ncbi:MAG: AAA family ATPase [Desulfohalobiaceae bacterium]|nr:AAA family ATPase [Desulfohalobiaceae bacterium]
MECPQCRFANRDGAKFCKKCGTSLELLCPSCGQPYESESLFCDECGQNLSEAQTSSIDYDQPQSYTPKHLADKILSNRTSLEGERKIVTVLFADVADSTALAENLDPEEVHQIMDGCFQILMEQIHRYEGTVNQFTGDGIMALFGAPVAHEDHTQRACRAALAIQKSMKTHTDMVNRDFGLSFRMRIGLNVGPVIVGAIGDDLRMDYTAVGDTTNLAARMENLARPGTVLLSEQTSRRVKDFFELKHLGQLTVKGKKEPQEAFELLKAGEAVTRLDAARAKGLTRFVGRENFLISLMEAYAKVKNGAGQVVGIVGEAGVGKSRLVAEFRDGLPQEEFTWLEGRCIHYGSAMPYLPILDILKTYFSIFEAEREVPIRKRVTEQVLQLDRNLSETLAPLQDLLSLKIEEDSYRRLEPKQKKERIFEALRNLFFSLTKNKPLILVIEDLHWIDSSSQAFLDYIIGWMARARIMLVLAYRLEYKHQWGNKSYFTRIGLDQLSLQSSAELVGVILEGGQAAPELRDIILNRAAGNPLFMEELTHTLLENGSIQKEEDQYVLSSQASELQIPETVQGIIAARIDRLEESLKKIMQVASVIGREFAFRILQTIIGMQDELKSHLLNLQGLEFIYEKNLFPELEYIFKHALTQEVAYNSLLSKRRREIHGNIGKAIEVIYADRLEEFYEMLAYHYARSEKTEQALHYLKASAKKAVTKYAPAEAFQFYREALGILKKMQATEDKKQGCIDIICLMAPSMKIKAFPDDSFQILQDGENFCRELQDLKSLTILQSHLGSYYSAKGNSVLGMQYQEKAFEAATQLQNAELIIQTGANLCWSYDYAGEFKKIVKAAPKVLVLLEKWPENFEYLGITMNLYPVLLALHGHALAYIGEFAQGEEASRQALHLAEQDGNLYTLANVEFLLGCQFVPKGEGERAIKYLLRSSKNYEKLGAYILLPVIWSLLSMGYLMLGQLNTALQYTEKAFNMLAKTEMPGFLSMGHLATCSVYLGLGRLAEADIEAEKALAIGQKNHERYCEGCAWLQHGRILGKMDMTDTRQAEESLLHGLKILKELETRPAYAEGVLLLAELFFEAGDADKGFEHLKKAEAMFSEMDMGSGLQKVHLLLNKFSFS